jgi:hypothetical protein
MLNNMSQAKAGLTAAAVNNKLYAIGGFNGTAYLNTVDEYDPEPVYLQQKQ